MDITSDTTSLTVERDKDFSMICIKVEIPEEICEVDDELKAIYHSRDTVCIWIFKTRTERNRFMDETIGMMKEERENHYETFFRNPSKK